MYELVKASIVNWHNFQPQDIPFGRFSAIVGQNKAGKSTLLDAIQVALLGNHGNWRGLNKAAGEDGTRSKRSVKAYCLGYVTPNHPPLRNDAITWITLHFRDTQTQHDCSIGCCFTASQKSERKEDTQLFVAKGLDVGRDDLVQDFIDADGDEAFDALPFDTVMTRLETRRADRRGAEILRPRTAKSYIGEHLKAMNAGGRTPQPEQFAKALVNAVAFQTVPSDDHFFKKYLLADRPIRIQELREAIQTYQGVHKRIQNVKAQLRQLREADKAAVDYLKTEADADVEDWIAARAGAGAAARALLENRRTRRRQRQKEQHNKDEQQRLEDYLGDLQTQLEDIKTRILSQDGNARATIEAQQKTEKLKKSQINERLDDWFTACNGLKPIVSDNLLPDIAAFAKLRGQIEHISRLTGRARDTFPCDAVTLDRALHDMENLDKLADDLRGQEEDAVSEAREKERLKSEKENQLQRIKQGGAPIERDTAGLMDMLSSQGYQPQVLCSLVRVTDPAWRDAAEALLGAEREAIILPPEEVEGAIKLWKQHKDRYRSCRIARTDKVDPGDIAQSPGMMSTIIVSDLPLVMAYLKRRIGNVRLSHRVEDLKKPGRAIMQDGLYDDGLSVRRMVRTDRPKLGKDIQQSAATDLADEMRNLEQQALARRREERMIRAAEQAVETLRGMLADTERESIEQLDQALLAAEERIQELHRQQQKLASQISPEWHQEKTDLENRIQGVQDDIKAAQKAEWRARYEADEAEKQITGGPEKVGSKMCWRHRHQAFRRARSAMPRTATAYLPAYAEALERFNRRLEKTSEGYAGLALNARKASEEKRKSAAKAREAFFERLNAYILSNPDSQAVTFRPSTHTVSEIKTWIDGRIQDLENDKLARYDQEMQAASKELTEAFQSAFISEIRDRIELVNRELERINAILKNRPFLNGEEYKWRSRRNDGHGEPFGHLFALADVGGEDPQRLLKLFDDTDDTSDPLQQDAAYVKELLLSGDFDLAQLERYQNYWTFWVEITDKATGKPFKLSDRKGIESGAEGQTPFYIIMAAAIAAAYRGGRHHTRQGGMGLALFDEAFSKMDPSNQKRMIDFFGEIGLQPIIAAPMSGSATALMTRMDTVNDVWRHGDDGEIESYHPSQRLREEVEKHDPSELTRADLEAILNSRREAAE